MSYSFNVKAANKEAAKMAVQVKFDETVVGVQSCHSRDRAAVLANVNSVIDLLHEDDNKDVSVSINGYVSWTLNDPQGNPEFNTVSIACQASHAKRTE